MKVHHSMRLRKRIAVRIAVRTPSDWSMDGIVLLRW
jgi:hypothetical protein